ncbi:hypothetical protein D1816_19425 [Aquimarina sp. AD10]|uniref:hypothetical protein n=1 Tax=Aquimarina sp. AD10 TaxID=1714849 RepID=UPI000E4B3156|nr:hypothetical protein [Aquimarina sp. AD10]AXT62443.1 hypothetical protein D1816_19425 [Aquimarina sp. AD10]RKM90362.1 hypothetical protein D7033_22955 [Aquimarina sp. AD10]
MNTIKTVQLDFGFECEPIQIKKKILKPNKKRDNDFVFNFMDCLTSPIIVFKSAWQDIIPKDILKNIKLSRLLCSMQQEEMASLTEALAYMMPRTYEAPMPTEWANIYTWLGLQYAGQFKNADQLGTMKEIAPTELSEYEMGLLNNLRRWIYDKRRKALKNILKKNTLKPNFPVHQKRLFVK